MREKKRTKTESGWAAFVRSLRLPEQAVCGTAQVTLVGQRQVTVENATGIDAYDTTRICLRLTEGRVVIEGESLCIDVFSEQTALIRGHVTAISFAGDA